MSPKFESMFQEMMRAGYDLHIQAFDGTSVPGGPSVAQPGRPDIYGVFDDTGVNSGVIAFTHQLLEEIDYITNYGTRAHNTLTLERVIAHEFAHAYQHATGKPYDGDAAEEQAAQIENEVMSSGSFNEPPRQGDPMHPTKPTYHDSAEPVSPRPVNGYPPAPPPPPLPAAPEEAVAACGAAENQSCPLVLDLDHSGTIDLISLANSQGYFDRDLDGFAEVSGLVAAEDGYLSIDINHNGQIDDNSELFGTATMGGFAVLEQYDTNNDDQITAEDTIWADLIIWQDTNENGYSEADELYTLADHDIIALNLDATPVQSTNQGHDIAYTGTFTVDAGGGPTNYAMHDVWFQYDNVVNPHSGVRV